MERSSVHIAVLVVAEDPATVDLANATFLSDRVSSAGHRIVAQEIVEAHEGAIRDQLARWISQGHIDVIISAGAGEAAVAALGPLVTSPLPGLTDQLRLLARDRGGDGKPAAARCGNKFVFLLPAEVPALGPSLNQLVLPQLDSTQPRNLVSEMPRHGAVPQQLPSEKTATGAGLVPKLPAARDKRKTGTNVISRKVDDPTKPIELDSLERKLAQSEAQQAGGHGKAPAFDAVTRPHIDIASMLPPVPPGADLDTDEVAVLPDGNRRPQTWDDVAAPPAPAMTVQPARLRPTSAGNNDQTVVRPTPTRQGNDDKTAIRPAPVRPGNDDKTAVRGAPTRPAAKTEDTAPGVAPYQDKPRPASQTNKGVPASPVRTIQPTPAVGLGVVKPASTTGPLGVAKPAPSGAPVGGAKPAAVTAIPSIPSIPSIGGRTGQLTPAMPARIVRPAPPASATPVPGVPRLPPVTPVSGVRTATPVSASQATPSPAAPSAAPAAVPTPAPPPPAPPPGVDSVDTAALAKAAESEEPVPARAAPARTATPPATPRAPARPAMPPETRPLSDAQLAEAKLASASKPVVTKLALADLPSSPQLSQPELLDLSEGISKNRRSRTGTALIRRKKSSAIVMYLALAGAAVAGFFAVVHFLPKLTSHDEGGGTGGSNVVAIATGSGGSGGEPAIAPGSNDSTTEPAVAADAAVGSDVGEIEVDTQGSASAPPPTRPTGTRPTRPPSVRPTRPPATTAKPPDTAAKPPEPPPVPVEDGCDEVSCVLEKYQRACCERFKPAESAFHPKNVVPDALDKTMVKAGIETVKPKVVACGEKTAAKGMVKLAITVSPEGKVSDISVSETPDPGLGDCVLVAVKRATFGKSVNGASFTYPFAF